MEVVNIVTGVPFGIMGGRTLILSGGGRSVPLVPGQTQGPHTGADFDWGSRNVGSANVAYHILAYIVGVSLAELLYCEYTDAVVSTWEDPAFAVSREEVERWVLDWIVKNVSRVSLDRVVKPEDN